MKFGPYFDIAGMVWNCPSGETQFRIQESIASSAISSLGIRFCAESSVIPITADDSQEKNLASSKLRERTKWEEEKRSSWQGI